MTSATSASVATGAAPAGAKGCFLDCATTDARVSFDNTDPSATNGLLLKKDQNPVFFPIAPTTNLKVVSTSGAAASVVDVQWVK